MSSIHFSSILRSAGGIDTSRGATTVMLGQSLLRLIRNTIRDWQNELDHIDFAASQGKAIDLLEQRLHGVPGFQGIIIDNTLTSGGVENECRAIIAMDGTAPREVRRSIDYVVAMVNMTSKTTITARIMPARA